MKTEVHPVCGVQKVWASYEPASNTIILWDGPGVAAAVGYIEGVVPVVHGHWIEHGIDEDVCTFDECSVCGAHIHMCRKNCVLEHENYCPHCGAKMDGEQDATD